MERLPSSSLRALLTFLETIAGVCVLDDFPRLLLAAVTSLIPGDSVSYNEVEVPHRRIVALVRPVEAAPAEYAPILERHLPEHPLIAHFRRTGDGRARTISEFLSQRQFHDLGIYGDFYGPLRIERQLAITLPAPPNVVLGLVVNRGGRDFSGRERATLEAARPHLVEAYRNADAIARLRQGLAASGVAAVLLDRDRRVRLMDERTRARLASAFGPFGARGDRLPSPLDRWVRAQSGRYRGDDVPAPASPLPADGGHRLVVRFLSGGPAADHDLLLVEEPGVGPTPEALVGLGLSRREAEVLALVVRGETNDEVGRRLGIGAATVDKHLEHVYRKLGVGTRTAAAAMALGLGPAERAGEAGPIAPSASSAAFAPGWGVR